MSIKNSTPSKVIKSTAAVGGALAVSFMPQYADAQNIVTVGGDGGTGTVTLSDSAGNNTTNIGSVLVNNLLFSSFSLTSFVFGSANLFASGDNSFGNPVRSSVSAAGVAFNPSLSFFITSIGAINDAVLGSSDNWIPGTFNVNGVNGGDQVFGWLQVELGSTFGSLDPTIISFTYDAEATDATPFTKPVGGFSVTTVPEPSSLSLLAMLALGAGGLRRHRRQCA